MTPEALKSERPGLLHGLFTDGEISSRSHGSGSCRTLTSEDNY